MRRAAIAGLVLLAALAGFLAWNRPRGRAGRATPAAEAGGGGEGTRVDAADGPREPVVEDEPRDTDGAEDPGDVAIQGTVVIVEEGGRALAEESGTLRIDVYGDDDSSPIEVQVVEVTRGRWRATAPGNAILSFGHIVLGGRKAVPLSPASPVPADGLVEVGCRWFVPTRLRVLGEKGEDLEDVEVVGDDDPRGEVVPGPQVTGPDLDRTDLPGGYAAKGYLFRQRCKLGSSPVELPEDEGTVTYWVRARDHAWSRITVSLGRGGERVVRLVRAGALDVRLAPPHPDARVDLYRLDEEVLEWQPDESGCARIEGLPPGRFEVRARVGEWSEAAEVDVEPGKTREVSLSLHDAPPAEERVPLEGTLKVDPAWPPPQGWVRIMMDSPYDPNVELGDDGRWSAGLVAPGRHTFWVEPWMWVQIVEVGLRGNAEARLAVPPPCEVEVHLVDAATGDAIASDAWVSWCVKSAEAGPDIHEWGEQRCESPGIYRLHAPVGTLVVSLWSGFLDATSTEVELKPGKNRVELRAVSNLSFDLALRDGAMPVPVDAGFSDGVRAAALDGEGVLDVCGTGDPCRVWVTRPGRYRVSFESAIEGYEPIGPVEVDVAPGTIPRVEIPLRRRER